MADVQEDKQITQSARYEPSTEDSALIEKWKKRFKRAKEFRDPTGYMRRFSVCAFLIAASVVRYMTSGTRRIKSR